MFLRNFDNINVVRRSPISLANPSASSTYGDGSLYCKNLAGYIQSIVPRGSMFTYFYNTQNSDIKLSDNNGSYCYIKWSDSTDEVSYDEYTVNLPATSSPVSVSTETVYNETDGSYTTTVKQVYVAKEDLTVGSIVICMACAYGSVDTYPTNKVHAVEIYREVLATPLEVAADASFVLTFEIKVSANPNKPADYTATASVE